MPPRIPYYRPQRAPRNMCRYVCVVTQSEIVASVQSVYTKWIGSPARFIPQIRRGHQ